MSQIVSLRLSPEQAPLVEELLAAPNGPGKTVQFERAGVDEETGDHHGARLIFDLDPPVPDPNAIPRIPPPMHLRVNPDGGDMGRGQHARQFERSPRDGDAFGFIALEGDPNLIERLATVSPSAKEIGGLTTFPVYGATGGLANRSLVYLTFRLEDLAFQEAS